MNKTNGNATSLYGEGGAGLSGWFDDVLDTVNSTVKDVTGLDIKETANDVKEVQNEVSKYNDIVKDATGIDVLNTAQNLVLPGSTSGTTQKAAGSTQPPAGNTTPAGNNTESLINYATTPVNLPGGTTATNNNTGVAGGNTVKTPASTTATTTSIPSSGNANEKMFQDEVARQTAVNEKKMNPNRVAELDGNWLTDKMDKLNKGGWIGAASGIAGAACVPKIGGLLIMLAGGAIGALVGHNVYKNWGQTTTPQQV